MPSNIYLLSKMMQHQALSTSFADRNESDSTDQLGFGSLFSGIQAQWLQGLTNTSSTQAVAGASVSANAAQYNQIIKGASQKYGVDEDLIRAVIQVESSFRPNVVSSAGAEGLMQLMPGTARSLGVSDSFDATQNISGGTNYLAQQIERVGDVKLALAAYNCGPSRVAQLGITDTSDAADYSKLFSSVRGYVDKVLANYDAYKAASAAGNTIATQEV